MPHILMLIPIIPPAFSGAGRRGWRMANGFQAMGAKVTVLTHSVHQPTGDNLRVVSLRFWGWRHRFRRGSLIRKGIGFVSALLTVVEAMWKIRREKPDVVYQMGCDFGPQLTGFAAILMRIPVVAESTLSGADDVETIKISRFGGVRFWVVRRYRKLVNISPALHVSALKAGLREENCRMIPNDVDVKHYRPASACEKAELRQKLGVPRNAFVVLSVGAISARKGMLELIEAYEDTLAQHPETLLLLIGPVREGEDPESAQYLARVRSKIDKAVLQGRIRLVGEVPDPVDWMKASDLFAFASRSEGFGTVVVEAMSCGLPLVIREIPGITQYIVGESPDATIVATDSELGPAMQGWISRATHSGSGSFNRERVLTCFSQEVVYRQYMRLFEEIAGITGIGQCRGHDAT